MICQSMGKQRRGEVWLEPVKRGDWRWFLWSRCRHAEKVISNLTNDDSEGEGEGEVFGRIQLSLHEWGAGTSFAFYTESVQPKIISLPN